MIKAPKFVSGKQDLFVRRMYVIRPNEDLIRHIKGLAEGGGELNDAPTVVMTEEAPFEEDIEAWGGAIRNKCKEAFLRCNINNFPLTVLEKPRLLLEDMDVLLAFFDKWWISERVADDIEIVRGSWKTDQCYKELGDV